METSDKKGRLSLRKNWLRRKLAKFVFFALLIFFLSGLSLIIIDRYLFPKLATVKWLEKFKFFKKVTEDVVVVNKTEQITISEDQTISRYSNKSASSVVELISFRRDSPGLARLGNSNQVKYGSGLIVTADGLILTHKEAIFTEPADYRVFVTKDNYFEARLVAVDSFSDLAFLKVDGASDLPVTSFIAPEDMKVGTKAVVIGRSGSGFQAVFKSGLVGQYASDFSLAGAVPLSEKLQGVYTTDFDMSGEGDERIIGGAVADYNGNVIGILGTRKIAGQNQYFIVPVNIVQELVNQYISTGSLKRGALGIYYLSLSWESTLLSGLPNYGALVYSPSGQPGLAILAGSAAERAGIRLMDVILSVDGKEVNAQQNLAYLISKYKPGDEVMLKIMREGKEMEAKVVLQ